MELCVGSKFFNYEDFDNALKNYQAANFTQFTIVNAERIPHGDPLQESLRYRVLRMQCKQGQKREAQTKDIPERPLQRSYKVGCPVMINVRLNRPKNQPPFLKITKLVLEHAGHDVSSEMFHLYPEQRRIQADEVDRTVLSALTIKTSEQRSILERRHDTAVMRQDVYNLQKRLGVGSGDGGRDDVKCREILMDIRAKGGHGEVGRDENGDFLFVTFQTRLMRDSLISFPECFIMDLTYKVNHYLYPLLTVMVINGEGHGVPAFHAFMAKEDKNIMERCLHIFRQQFNPSNTRCFIVDKDMAEIAAIGAIFPGVPVNLCHFHISQAVERYLRKEIGRGASVIPVVLDSFMNQVNTESEEQFRQLKVAISNIVPQPVIDYFELNWWSKCHLWAACCNTYVMRFHATTTNAIESYHSKIKKAISEKLSLSNVLSALITFNDSKITEQRRLQLLSSNCSLVDHRDKDATSVQITNCLTRFGAQIVGRELLLSSRIGYTVFGREGQSGEYIVSFRDRQHITTPATCTCSTFGHFKLPCRHIFATRRHAGLTLFEAGLVPDRFQNSGSGVGISSAVPDDTHLPVHTVPSVPFSLRTVEGRYRKAKSICDKAAAFLSILGVDEFQHKLQQLEDFFHGWSDFDLCQSSVPVVTSVRSDISTAATSSQTVHFGLSSNTPPVSSISRSPGDTVQPVIHPCPSSPVFTVQPAVISDSPPVSSITRSSAVPPTEIHPCPSSPLSPVFTGRSAIFSYSPPVSSVDNSSAVPPTSGGHTIQVQAEIHPCPASPLVTVQPIISDSPPVSSISTSSAAPPTSIGHSIQIHAEIHPATTSPLSPVFPGRSAVFSNSPPVSSVHSSSAVPPTSGDEAEIDSCPLPPLSPDSVLPESTVLTSCQEATSEVAGHSNWPTMSRLLKPRGRPGNRQRFTKLSSHPHQKNRRKIPTLFSDLADNLKAAVFVQAVSVHHAVPSSLIQSDELKDLEAFSDCVLDDRFDLSSIEALFQPSAWAYVKHGIDTRLQHNMFYCGLCKEVDNMQLKMIQCEHCLLWYHFHCVGYRSRKKVKTWFCDSCL